MKDQDRCKPIDRGVRYESDVAGDGNRFARAAWFACRRSRTRGPMRCSQKNSPEPMSATPLRTLPALLKSYTSKIADIQATAFGMTMALSLGQADMALVSGGRVYAKGRRRPVRCECGIPAMWRRGIAQGTDRDRRGAAAGRFQVGEAAPRKHYSRPISAHDSPLGGRLARVWGSSRRNTKFQN